MQEPFQIQSLSWWGSFDTDQDKPVTDLVDYWY